jgi:hypothetical protein
MITGKTGHRFAPGDGMLLVILVQIFHVLECIKAISTASKTIADFGLPLNRTAISNSQKTWKGIPNPRSVASFANACIAPHLCHRLRHQLFIDAVVIVGNHRNECEGAMAKL